MNNILTKILTILSKRDRQQLYTLFFVMLAMGILEVVGIGSIMPFMAALTNMDVVFENEYLRYFYDLFNFDSQESFVVFLGSAVLSLMIARNVLFGLANWLVSRFTFMWRHNLSEQLLHKYLMQPYAFFLSKNTLELKRHVCNETSRLVGGIIIPGIQVCTKVIITFLIITLLVIIDPYVALVVASAFGGSYLVLYGLVYRKLSRLSKQASELRRFQYKVASEAFEGIKELKLSGKERRFIADYSALSRKNAALETVSRAVSQLPRYGIETLAVSGVMLFILYLIADRQDVTPWVPVLAVYVVAGYRMLPALQQIFSGLTTIRYNLSTLDVLHADFTGLPVIGTRDSEVTDSEAYFKNIKSVKLRGIGFRYGDRLGYTIENLDLTIERNTTVGLVGPTGSGKTTIVDIILGLLKPVSGELTVNEVLITSDNIRAWQKRIGYVPQHIYLFDDTIARNIAFGIPAEDIDYPAVEKASRIANLHDYITHDLSNGYSTIVGQRGIRLSGGQRQRIGIARALYHNPDILILDEATSALDGVTESAVMDAIQRLSHKLTIIMIAHRLNTVKNCDVIHYIDEGRIVSSGTYADLSGRCEHFQKMADA